MTWLLTLGTLNPKALNLNPYYVSYIWFLKKVGLFGYR